MRYSYPWPDVFEDDPESDVDDPEDDPDWEDYKEQSVPNSGQVRRLINSQSYLFVLNTVFDVQESLRKQDKQYSSIAYCVAY